MIFQGIWMALHYFYAQLLLIKIVFYLN